MDVGNSQWQWTNSDVVIVGDSSLTAIFRVRNGANWELSNVSVQRCTSGPAVLFALAVDEGNTDDEVFNGNNVVLNNIALWEIADLQTDEWGYNEDGQNTITCQNCQGCAQFVADQGKLYIYI